MVWSYKEGLHESIKNEDITNLMTKGMKMCQWVCGYIYVSTDKREIIEPASLTCVEWGGCIERGRDRDRVGDIKRVRGRVRVSE